MSILSISPSLVVSCYHTRTLEQVQSQSQCQTAWLQKRSWFSQLKIYQQLHKGTKRNPEVRMDNKYLFYFICQLMAVPLDIVGKLGHFSVNPEALSLWNIQMQQACKIHENHVLHLGVQKVYYKIFLFRSAFFLFKKCLVFLPMEMVLSCTSLLPLQQKWHS